MTIVCSGAGGYNGGGKGADVIPFPRRMQPYLRGLSSNERSRISELIHRINVSHGMRYERLLALGSAESIAAHIEGDLRALFSPDRVGVMLAGQPAPELFAAIVRIALEQNRSIYVPDTAKDEAFCSGDKPDDMFKSFTANAAGLGLDELNFAAYRSVLVKPVTLMGFPPRPVEEYERMGCLILAGVKPNSFGPHNLVLLEPLGILAANMASAIKRASH